MAQETTGGISGPTTQPEDTTQETEVIKTPFKGPGNSFLTPPLVPPSALSLLLQQGRLQFYSAAGTGRTGGKGDQRAWQRAQEGHPSKADSASLEGSASLHAMICNSRQRQNSYLGSPHTMNLQEPMGNFCGLATTQGSHDGNFCNDLVAFSKTNGRD